MLDFQQWIIDRFAEGLQSSYRKTYGIMRPDLESFISWAGRLALEAVANSDSLYHNLDHTMMVTLAGQEILSGKHLCEGGVTPEEWTHLTVALLCHDIGYVKGICRKDGHGVYATGKGSEVVELPPGGTDAALGPYHVDRSKLFVRERFGGKLLIDLDAELIASFIEMTRFPVPDDDFYKDTRSHGGLVRAADFIGQLGDPHYLRKIPALFYEFEETGINAGSGYETPGDMRASYAKFFWNEVTPYIQEALRYLRVTLSGRQWIANLYAHVFSIEHNR